ncbi:Fic family protein [Aliiroseovarius crassostreae]|nr:Fic/DOC family N-terminal domain-containing protein [Aliiroseovarius crassostreae]
MAEIALSLAEAHGAIGELKGACRRLQNPYIFIKPMQRLEAQTSSAMEGTHTTNEKLAMAEAGVNANGDDQTAEVLNYVRALETAIESLNELPISSRLIRTAHQQLLQNVGISRGEDKLPGEFKRDQNMIGGRTLEAARFIPAPPLQTADCMSDLEVFINSDRGAQYALIDMALVHYQFETIHPFADGNGRVGRMLISLMAVSRGLLDLPALFLSPALEGVKDDYIEKMYRVSAFGEWNEWLNFFFSAVTETARRTVDTIDRIISLQEIYREKAAAVSTSNNLQSVVDMLFEQPVIRPKDIVNHVGVTDAAARGLLSKLMETGILVEVDMYPKTWIALELIKNTRPD